MSYLIYSLSVILVYIALASLLHLQFGVAGIVNFGIVGFWGLGMYTFGIFLIQLNLPFIVGLVLAVGITGLVALGLGWIILKLDGQSILVATLAFATIIQNLVTTEKWITNGVVGLGTVPFPIKAGRSSDLIFFIILILVNAGLFWYASKMEKSPYGRLLLSIQDNETLARGLGKSTFRQKLIFFTFTSALMVL